MSSKKKKKKKNEQNGQNIIWNVKKETTSRHNTQPKLNKK